MLTNFDDYQPKKKKRKKPEDYEHQEQVALIEWATSPIVLGVYPELAWLHAIPNGGKRTIQTAIKLKAEGVKQGVPDLSLPVPRHGYHGLYIELKAIYPDGTTGKPSKIQKVWIKALEAMGYRAIVAYGWEEAQREIESYLSEV